MTGAPRLVAALGALVPIHGLKPLRRSMFVDRPPRRRLPVRPVADLAERPAAFGGQHHVGLALVGDVPRLVGLRLAGRGLVPVDGKLGQDLERRALARAAADLLEEQPAAAQQLAADAVRRVRRAGRERIFVLPLVELVQHLPRLREGLAPGAGRGAAGLRPPVRRLGDVARRERLQPRLLAAPHQLANAVPGGAELADLVVAIFDNVALSLFETQPLAALDELLSESV